MIHPAAARATIAGLMLYDTPSEISNSMRTAERTFGAGAATRAPRKEDTATGREEQRRVAERDVVRGAADVTKAIAIVFEGEQQ